MLSTPDKIRLVVSDVDGTLVRGDGSIGERTLRALRTVHHRGVHVALSSGRMPAALTPLAEKLGFPVILSGYNGAAIYGPPGSNPNPAPKDPAAVRGRRLIFHRPLEKQAAREIFAWGRQLGVQINYYLDEFIHTTDHPRTRPFLDLYRGRTGSPVRFVESMEPFLDRPPAKVLFVTTPERRELLYEEAVRRRFRANVTRSDPEYLEFMEPSVNKGSGLATLCAELGVDPGRVMAVGDGENDVPLLRAAGWGVAVANARPAAKEAADIVTEADHEHDALAEALERWGPRQ